MSAPDVLFPDAEALVIDELADRLGDWYTPAPTVASRVPDPRPTPFVLVRRLGGPRRDLVTDSAQLGIEAWAETETGAHELAQLARTFVHACAGGTLGGVAVYRVQEFAGPQNLPDPLSSDPRYVFTVLIDLRGAALGAPGS